MVQSEENLNDDDNDIKLKIVAIPNSNYIFTWRNNFTHKNTKTSVSTAVETANAISNRNAL